MNPTLVSRAVAIALVFGLYSATMCRWIGAGDTAIVVWNMDQAILSSHVNNHPAMVAIGWVLLEVLPGDSAAWKANWFSVIFTTVYLGLFHLVASRSLKDPLHALLATLVVAVTHSVWWHATIVENYALNGVSLLAVTWLLLREHETSDFRYVYGASVVAGLAVLNHAQMGFLAPVLGVYALVRTPRDRWLVLRRWLLLAVGWGLGLLPFAGLLARNIARGHKSDVVVKNAMGSHFTAIMFDLRLDQIGTIFWREVLVQFPSPVLLLLPFGIWFAFKDNPRWRVNAALGAGFLVNSGFFMLYHTWDRFAFLLPSYLILLLWLCEGWGWALRWAREQHRPNVRRTIALVALICVAMPPMVYRELPRLGRAGLFWHNRFSSNGQWNTHDVAGYLANPDKSGWNDLDRVNRLLIDKLPPRAVVIDDDGRNHYTLELYFQKVRGERRDVRALLVNAWGFEGWGQDKAKLADKIAGWRNRSQVFAMSLMPPHRKWQGDLADKGIGPVPVYLADDVWIYRFDERPRGAEEPFLWELMTGLRLEGNTQMLTHQLGPDDRGQYRIRYRKTTRPATVSVRWAGPGGVLVEDLVELPVGTERTVRPVPAVVLATPGRWRATAEVDGRRDTFLELAVTERSVDRRQR